MDAHLLGFKYMGIMVKNCVGEIIRYTKVGDNEGIEMNTVVYGELLIFSNRDSYIRASVREKNLIKSREIEIRLSACLQEDGDNTMATELSKIL